MAVAKMREKGIVLESLAEIEREIKRREAAEKRMKSKYTLAVSETERALELFEKISRSRG